VTLRWSTITETNNYGFDIERSNDGVQFEKIVFINGNGTKTSKQIIFIQIKISQHLNIITD
jgi:hypothetical protein